MGLLARALRLRPQQLQQQLGYDHAAHVRTVHGQIGVSLIFGSRKRCNLTIAVLDSLPRYLMLPTVLAAAATNLPAHNLLRASIANRLSQGQMRWFAAASHPQKQYVYHAPRQGDRRSPVIAQHRENGDSPPDEPYQSRAWVFGCVALGIAFYVWNLDRVPMTGRLRFNVISNDFEKVLGDWQFEDALEECRGKFLPPSHPWVIHVKHVTSRILAAHQHEPDMKEFNFRVFVIDAPNEFNAFVLPGGQIFVFTGLLRLCKDEEGLATVLGHEIAHVRAHHLAERTSQNLLTLIGAAMAFMMLGILGPGYAYWNHLETVLPHSRTQEEEADRIGLQMLAQSCYEPAAATELWRRINAVEQVKVPELLSTHPTSHKRMELLTRWQTSTTRADPPGYTSHDAEDGAVIRNIEACNAIAQTVQTSLGPYGKNKIVINHLQKLILTSDAATILRELEVVHPAAKLLVMASQQQEAELGDATNLVIIFAGELLKKAEGLLRMGLKSSDIVQGYEKAQNFALKCLEDLEVDRLKDIRSKDELEKALRTVIASKQSGSEDILAPLVAEAVLAVLPKNPTAFNVDNVRVVKIMGGSLEQSRVIKGMVFARRPEGTIKKAHKAKVGVFSCPIDISQTETKGTVLLKNAQEMMDFTKGEEARLEATIKELYDSGLRVVVAGSTVGELALHYLNRFNILVIKVLSKFEIRRLCRVVGATPLARLGAPMPDEMGTIDVVETEEIGGDRVTVFRQEESGSVTRTATIVLRGATQNHLEDVERAIDDGVNVVKAITKDPRLVPGAGATEVQLAERISAFADMTPGLSQYAIKKYAEAFEIIPRSLAESAGLDATEVLSRLYTAHQQRKQTDSEEDEAQEERPYWTTGVDIESSTSAGTLDAVEEGILDLMVTKNWAIKLATEAARTVLSVDQIIVARQAGGPKPPSGQNPNWDED
ncbi:T-complex protein 1 subunit theta [Ascosphaera aggregata]|nr:T-complex protein 1 subunit theta [Ascosphaera aggregata]